MKKLKYLLPIIFILFAFTDVSDTVTITDNYKLYQDGEVIFETRNRAKLIDSSSNTKHKFPESDVRYTQPTVIQEIGEGGNTIAVIESDSFEIKHALKVNEPTKAIFGSSCNSDVPSLLIVSEVPFDFKDQPITLKKAIWYIQKGLFNNGIAITADEAINQKLIVKSCSKTLIIEN